MKIKFAMLLAASSLLYSGTATAESLVEGDAEAGKARAITCTACHGPEGISASPLWPNLAGQNAPYTLAQLKAFKAGKRIDPLMSSQAMMLSDEDMANLAVYFESLPAAVQAVADIATVEGAEALYRGGDLEDKTAACLACHGPSGAGNPAAKYPAVAGQHAAYSAKQLRDYRSGTRTTDGKTRIMQNIAATLDDKEIEALSSYMQGLH
ncbi:MAG: c-type cytochrome [Pseudomonadota bacterium]